MKPYYQDNFVTQHQGHVLDVLPQLPDESVHCVMTSIPYWGLRDYGLPPQIWDDPGECEHEWISQERWLHRGSVADSAQVGATKDSRAQITNAKTTSQFCQLCGAWRGSLGLEPTPDLYISHVVQVFREIWRVGRKDCTVWLNIGDSYATGSGKVGEAPGGGRQGERFKQHFGKSTHGSVLAMKGLTQPNRMPIPGLKPKDLCGIPWRVALALQADGWWLRSDVIERVEIYCPHCGWQLEERIWRYSQDREIIWEKPNPMPESVTDRPTRSHEYVFLLTKSGTSQFWTHPRKRGVREKPKPDYIWTHKNTGLVVSYQPVSDRILREFWKRKNLWQGHDYFYDADAIKEEESPDTHARYSRGRSDKHKYADGGPGNQTIAKSFDHMKLPSNWDTEPGHHKAFHRKGRRPPGVNPKAAKLGLGIKQNESFSAAIKDIVSYRNKRSVWTIATEPTPEAHFATFPEKLVIPCIKAGTSEKGCCPECGAPWVRVVEKMDTGRRKVKSDYPGKQTLATSKYIHDSGSIESKTIGWKPSCDCGIKETIPCTVLDPFSGSGKVGLMAKKLDRKAILIELKKEYCDMPIKKLAAQRFDFHGTVMSKRRNR